MVIIINISSWISRESSPSDVTSRTYFSSPVHLPQDSGEEWFLQCRQFILDHLHHRLACRHDSVYISRTIWKQGSHNNIITQIHWKWGHPKYMALHLMSTWKQIKNTGMDRNVTDNTFIHNWSAPFLLTPWKSSLTVQICDLKRENTTKKDD